MVKILLIDDEKDIREVVTKLLELEGFEVSVASDGNEGIKRFREEQSDIIITDIIMPGKDGVDAIKEFRSEFPDVKIIAISGGGKSNPRFSQPSVISTTAYLTAAESAGADLTLTKPFDKKQLLAVIQQLL